MKPLEPRQLTLSITERNTIVNALDYYRRMGTHNPRVETRCKSLIELMNGYVLEHDREKSTNEQ